MRYVRRAWDENRGDEYASWGTSLWYFEIGDEGYVSRQLEVYASGDALAYDARHEHDGFGMLADQRLIEPEWAGYEITAAEFEAAWSAARLRNR